MKDEEIKVEMDANIPIDLLEIEIPLEMEMETPIEMVIYWGPKRFSMQAAYFTCSDILGTEEKQSVSVFSVGW